MIAELDQIQVLDDAAMKRELRRQIARLEKRAASEPHAPGERGAPRLLSVEELEEVRDALAARVTRLLPRGDDAEAARVLLERMLADPKAHRRERIALNDLGLPGCGVYRPRPRLGLVGRLAGWWQVKLSSGCP